MSDHTLTRVQGIADAPDVSLLLISEARSCALGTLQSTGPAPLAGPVAFKDSAIGKGRECHPMVVLAHPQLIDTAVH
jgi:hypothetical protein